MTFRQAVRFLLWSCEKRNSGDQLTGEELDLHIDAWQVIVHFADESLGLKPDDWEYKDGQSFK